MERSDDMFKKKPNTKVTKEGGDNVETTLQNSNYTITAARGSIQVHHYGAYMSYSNEDGDFLCRLFAINPYTRTEGYLEQVGIRQKVVNTPETKTQQVRRDTGGYVTQTVYTGGPSTQTIVEEPVLEHRRRVITPPFTAYGVPIKVGDKVTFKGVAGTLDEVSDHYFLITNDTGRHYFPWTDTNHQDKVTRQK